MNKALFLDRDGTLIIDQGYLSDPEGVELIPGVITALKTARDLGYMLFLFTNQSGIGRGFYTVAEAQACNQRMLDLLGLGDDLFTAICIAPETPDQPLEYRKPSPRFILEMRAKHSLDPDLCWMVGDRESDVEAGLNAKIHAAALCTGKYDQTEWAQRLPTDAALHKDFASFVQTLA